MRYYTAGSVICCSLNKIERCGDDELASELDEIRKSTDGLVPEVFLFSADPEKCRSSFALTDAGLLSAGPESVGWLNLSSAGENGGSHACGGSAGLEPQTEEALRRGGSAGLEPQTEEALRRGGMRAVNVMHPRAYELVLKASMLPIDVPKAAEVRNASASGFSPWDIPRTGKNGGYRVNILAMGDVGGMLLTGLKLLGAGTVDEIGIADINENAAKRWEFEANQMSYALDYDRLPEVKIISPDEFFDCDAAVFCATKGVPPVKASANSITPDTAFANGVQPVAASSNGGAGNFRSADTSAGAGGATKPIDVRMAQFEANSGLVAAYAKRAAACRFDGLFCQVSDPVDQLAGVFLTTCRENGHEIFPERIQGFGLGVMNARAAYYAQKDKRFSSFLSEGRSFGAHGKGLVIADSIRNYHDDLSRELTEKALNANLAMRSLGYKPYAAPAISSGAISILQTLRGEWHYSSCFLGGRFFGCRNRYTEKGLQIERLQLPDELMARIEESANENA
ncbi:MAG: lactate dehydrogenase [Eubacterium sp.]|jgi:hypothetical protein